MSIYYTFKERNVPTQSIGAAHCIANRALHDKGGSYLRMNCVNPLYWEYPLTMEEQNKMIEQLIIDREVFVKAY